VNPLPDDLKHLLAIEPRLIDVRQAPHTITVVPDKERETDPERRLAVLIDRLQPGGAARHPAVSLEQRWWFGEVVPMGNPVLVGYELRERGFLEADAVNPQFVRLRPVEPGEEETP
jgi:hypothetical protein